MTFKRIPKIKSTISMTNSSITIKVNNNSYTGTSFEAIRNVCKDLKLGFNSYLLFMGSNNALQMIYFTR